MIDIAAIAANLEPGPDGIWVSRSRSEISYPEEGNEHCLALEAGSFWFSHRNHCIETILKCFPPPGVLFDVGGGNGYVAAGLQRTGIPVTLVEPGWQGALNARQRGVERVICSTLEDAGFQEGAIPAFGLFDVLEHIQDQEAFLHQLHCLLPHGGRGYLTVPAYPLLWSADDDYAGHHRRYTLGSLQRVLQAAGFRVIFSSYFFWFLPPPIFLFRSIPTRLGLRKQAAWNQYNQEHRELTGVAGHLLNWVLEMEIRRLRQGQAIPFGGSCLVAVEK